MDKTKLTYKVARKIYDSYRFLVADFKIKNLKKGLHSEESSYILILAVTLIAVKREVAALIKQVFRGANVNAGDNLRRRNWRQVTVPKSSAIRRNDARGSNYE